MMEIVGDGKSLDDSVIVVGSYSPQRRRENPSARSMFDDSVIVIDDDNSKTSGQRPFDLEGTVIILDSDDEIEEKLVSPDRTASDKDSTITTTKSQSVKSRNMPTSGNMFGKPTGWGNVDFIPLSSFVASQMEGPRSVRGGDCITSSVPLVSCTVGGGNTATKTTTALPQSRSSIPQSPNSILKAAKLGAVNSTNPSPNAHVNSSWTLPATSNSFPCPPQQTASNSGLSSKPGITKVITLMPRNAKPSSTGSSSTPMDVECEPNSPDPTVRKVLYNPTLGDGGSLTATLKFTKSSAKPLPPKSKSPKKNNAKLKPLKSAQNKDSFRHFMGISKHSKTWPQKQKNKKKKKKSLVQATELDLNKVVLGIRNLSNEHNSVGDVKEFTSGKSPHSRFGGQFSFDERLRNNGTSVKSPTISAVTVNLAVKPVLNDNTASVKAASTTTENTAPNFKSGARTCTPEVVLVDNLFSDVDRRIARVNPSKHPGIQITFSNVKKGNVINLSQKCKPNTLAASQWLPPPSPRTFLQRGRYFSLAEDSVRPALTPQITIPKPVQLQLRPIAIDGSNVAFTHGKQRFYSCRGIQISIEFFQKRGHKVVRAFVPQFRRTRSYVVKDQEILETMSRGDQQTIVFTPSRKVNDTLITSYDDRFIVEYAVQSGAVMVSNDNYRDIMQESAAFKDAIEKRLLMFTFVDDLFMVPQDPLGRLGPCLDKFLSFDSD